MEISIECVCVEGPVRCTVRSESLDAAVWYEGPAVASSGGMEVKEEAVDGGGISPSINCIACSTPTLGLLLSDLPFGKVTSILFPTKTQQNLSTWSSGTGARSLKSFHHLMRASSDDGWLTSNIKRTASAPLKKADDRLENRSWPAVSCNAGIMSTSNMESEGGRMYDVRKQVVRHEPTFAGDRDA